MAINLKSRKTHFSESFFLIICGSLIVAGCGKTLNTYDGTAPSTGTPDQPVYRPGSALTYSTEMAPAASVSLMGSNGHKMISVVGGSVSQANFKTGGGYRVSLSSAGVIGAQSQNK